MTHNNCELVKIDMMPEECPNELQSGPKCFSSVNEDRVVQTIMEDVHGVIRKVFTNLGPVNLDITVTLKRIRGHLDRPYDLH